MYATLVIKNIGKLYTCDSRFTIYKHAFIALYHDLIIDAGCHDYHKWCDGSTYVIDAASRAVIPSFIEPFFKIKAPLDVTSIKDAEEKINYLQHNGTGTICTDIDYLNLNPLYIDIIKVDSFQSCLNDLSQFTCHKDLLITSQKEIVSQHAIGSILYTQHHAKAKDLLKAMTCNVAKTYHLKNRGMLKKGYIADILILNSFTIDSFYASLGKPLYARIIKKGIPVYPYITRV